MIRNLAVGVLVSVFLIRDLVSARGDGALSARFAAEMTALAFVAVCAWAGAQKLRASGRAKVLLAFQAPIIVSLLLLMFASPDPRSDAVFIAAAASAAALILPTAIWLERRARL